MNIFVIDDDEIMAECMAHAARTAATATFRVINHSTMANSRRSSLPEPSGVKILTFASAVVAMGAIAASILPDLIFLDVLLDGPDGFTLLNELSSYADTAKIPIVLVSSVDLGGHDLSAYGVVGVLDKSKMKPEDIRRYVQQYAH